MHLKKNESAHKGYKFNDGDWADSVYTSMYVRTMYI